MATLKDNRPIPSTGVDPEFERGAGSTHYTTVKNQTSGRDNQNMWVYVVIALLVLAGGLYYYMGSNATPGSVPEVTQTTPPVTSTTPEVVTPPVTPATPEIVTPPATTPDPAAAPKTTP
jgi:hypothetical protein